MPKLLITPLEIQNWVPPTLNHIVGCPVLRSHFCDMLRVDGCGVNTFVFGEPGTGKTAVVKAFVRSLMCPHRERESGTPCGNCETCRSFDVRYDDKGLFAHLQPRATGSCEAIHFYPVNCGEVTEAKLREILSELREYEGHSLVYLDEVHRLIRRKMEHMLLVPLQELKTMWIASTAMPDDLDRMFQRRFAAKIATTLPEVAELTEFLRQRCEQWNVSVDHDPGTLDLLARRSRRITSDAVGQIAVAAGTKNRTLTRDLVLRAFT